MWIPFSKGVIEIEILAGESGYKNVQYINETKQLGGCNKEIDKVTRATEESFRIAGQVNK